MVLVQINLDEDMNKLLNMYKLVHNLKSKEDAIRYLIINQRDKIEEIKEKNKKYIEQAEKEADNLTEAEEENLKAREELFGA